MPDESQRSDLAGQPAAAVGLATDGPPEFLIVGVGASAGGLDALGSLLKSVTLDGTAFVVIQHLSPKHDSMLPALLSRVSNLKVVSAADGMKVETNHVYVIPPKSDLAILQRVLHLLPAPAERGPKLPIDHFFRSLAKDAGPRSIGVVLSGTGTDGTFGLKAIKEAGGITFAQEPSSAKYDGMPRSAIESSYADFSMTPEAIGRELMNLGSHPYLTRPPTPASPPAEGINKLIALMRKAFGNDLGGYKSTTVERRTHRRMALHKIENLDAYVNFVGTNDDELRLLYKDMLIGVTSFFRDRDPFDALTTQIFPRMIEQKEPQDQIRLWTPACSTGEEAYSLAMCLVDYLGDRARDFKIQVFATDVDEMAIQRARRGLFASNIAQDVSPEYLRGYFIKTDNNEYQVSRQIRDLVVFSVQNVTKDAPFSRLDLVSCRNLLIYLQPSIQKRVLRTLHYALNPTGYLMVGTSETVGEASDLFALVDASNKIYAKVSLTAARRRHLDFTPDGPSSPALVQPAVSQRPSSNLAALADRTILDLYGPPGLVLNEELEVVHIRARTGSFLDPAPGAPSFNIQRLVRPEMRADVRSAIRDAQSKNQRVVVQSKVIEGNAIRPFMLEVVPLGGSEAKLPCLLVLFHEPAAAKPVPIESGAPEESGSAERERTRELERELLVTREYLQSTIGELENTNEELKAANEELQSANEELQSTNEELETSKEELQSGNEELTTLNDELQGRMGELEQTNDDLHNVLAGVGNAVVIVDLDLRIRRFNQTAERLLNLAAGDVGRPVSFLTAFVFGEHVDQLAQQVIQTNKAIEKDVFCSDQRWHALSILPYKTLEHAIRGTVVTLADSHVRKQATEKSRLIAEYGNRFLSVIDHPLLIVDQNLRVAWANHIFLEEFDLTLEETIGAPLPTLGDRRWVTPDLAKLIEGTLATGAHFRDHAIAVEAPGAANSTVRVSGSRIPSFGDDSSLVLLAFQRGEIRAPLRRPP